MRTMARRFPKLSNDAAITMTLSIGLSLLLLLTYSLTLKARSDYYYEEVYSSWQELDERTQPTLPSLPLATASDALQFVVRNTKLLSSLKDVEEKGEHDGWSVMSKRIESNEEMMWSVRIKSRGFIPSYTCVQTFRSSGEVTSDGWPDNYCSYNK